MKRLLIVTVAFLSFSLFAAAASAQEQAAAPKPDADKWVREAEEAIAKVDNYTFTFHKLERINGKMWPAETVLTKFKRPFMVFMVWPKDPYMGRHTLYVKGRFSNKLCAREGSGFKKAMGSMCLDPTGSLAMEGNRHPATDAGLENLINKIGGNMRRAIKADELELKDHGNETVYGRQTQKLEGILPKDKAKGYYAYRVIVWLDTGLKVPIKVQVYDWDNLMVEEYGFEDVKFNAGLTDDDFNVETIEFISGCKSALTCK
jgi:outer membrane lipoprotein-sorting protein